MSSKIGRDQGSSLNFSFSGGSSVHRHTAYRKRKVWSKADASLGQFLKSLRYNSISGKVSAFGKWLIGAPGGDSQGRDGWASPGSPNGPSDLGHALGWEKSSAWISIAGSIPGLLLDSFLVVTGISMRKRYPALGSFLAGTGGVNHLMSSSYPISAAMMSEHELHHPKMGGHDFANFACQMSDVYRS